MKSVRKKIVILSGKGGVGKSTFTTALGWALASDEDIQVGERNTLEPDEQDRLPRFLGGQTGIMDVDICGPSIPLMLGLQDAKLHATSSGWSPLYVLDNLCVMSIGFLLPSSDAAVIWRGPKKNGLIKQFLKDVDWASAPGSELDYLLIDTPPGTSDEHLSIVQYLKECGGVDGAVVLTTPQEVDLQDVRKEIDFCRKVGIPILGVVENMCGFVCPSCKGESDIFIPSTGGAKKLCEEMDLTLLGKVPLDPRIGKACDFGTSYIDEYPDSPATTAYLDIVDKIRVQLGDI